jgi:serine/threonine-protein kinase
LLRGEIERIPRSAGFWIAQVFTVSVFLAIWLGCRRGRRSVRVLDWIDTAGLFVVSAALSGAMLLNPRTLVPIYVLVLAVTHLMVLRALVVPSSAIKTFAIGSLASLPVLAVVFLRHGEDGAAESALERYIEKGVAAQWCLIAIAISTTASGVIYSLRRSVREAMKLGQYTLEGKIGEGAMGMVFRASHAMMRRPTAVKLLRPENASEVNIARFEREVQLTSQLTSPHTIAIYDYGRSLEGVFYYAMEYLPGIDLQRLVEAFGPLREGRAIHVLRQACESLQEAHQAGLIHRDIKPANLIVCERGGVPDMVKVLDFGLVKDISGAGDPALSAAGTIAGTPLYLSPEAILKPAKVDARSDVYSLGAVAYFLVTGKPVFESENAVEVCIHQVKTAPVPPSQRTGRAFAADLEGLVLRCLAKEPGERYQSAAELLDALDACGDASAWGKRQAREWWERHRSDVSKAHAPEALSESAESSLAGSRTLAVKR